MEISKELYQEIKAYCKANGIKNLKEQVDTCLRYGFNVLKYGDNPFTYHNPMDDMPKANDINVSKDMVIKSVNYEPNEGKIVITYWNCDGNTENVDVFVSSIIDTTPQLNTENISGISNGRVDEKVENQLSGDEQPSSESTQGETFGGSIPKGKKSETEKGNTEIKIDRNASEQPKSIEKPKRKVKIIRRNKSTNE